jgi:plasmid stabilization system protein ParE
VIVRSVRLSRSARDDIDRLTDFLQGKSERAAARAAQAITEAVLSLSEFSERGHPAKLAGWRELIVRFGRDGYVIRYRIEGESVFVTRVFHGRERR